MFPAFFAFREKGWHLNIILLTCKLTAANSITPTCIRRKKNVCMNMKPITGGYRLSLNKIQTEFNELSSSSTLTFPLQFLHLFTTIIHPTSISLFPPVPPAHPSASRAQFFILNPLLCLHLFLSPSKTTAIPERGPSIFFNETRVRESAKATTDYYLSLPPLNTG